MKIDVLAYPLSSNNYAVLENNFLLKHVNIIEAVSGELKDTAYEKNHASVPIFEDFETGLTTTKAEAVLVLPLTTGAKLHSVAENIKTAIHHKKRIYSLYEFPTPILEDIIIACSDAGTEFISLCTPDDTKYESLGTEIWTLNTPVILCASINDNCSIIELELAIRKRFLNQGYTVGQIGSFPYSEAFDIHPFPSFMFCNELSLTERTLSFHRHLKEIETLEQPDVMIIALPEALCPYSNKFPLGFGNLAYLVSNAFTSDYTVISLHLGVYDEKFLSHLDHILEYRFNLKPDAYVMSDIFADYSDADSTHAIRYYRYRISDIEDSIHKSSRPITNIKIEEELDKLCNTIIEELSNNII